MLQDLRLSPQDESALMLSRLGNDFKIEDCPRKMRLEDAGDCIDVGEHER